MDLYEIWFDRAPHADDLELVGAVHAWLGFLQSRGELVSYRISRRKFGFGPSGMGEFHVTIEFDNLTQLDTAFSTAARRYGEVEELHRAVYSRLTNYTSALYRDFPDPVRGQPV